MVPTSLVELKASVTSSYTIPTLLILNEITTLMEHLISICGPQVLQPPQNIVSGYP